MRHQMVRGRLAGFLFGQYFALGVWFVALGPYMSKALHFDDAIGLAYALQGLAAIASSMIAGVVADRYLAPRKLLSLLMVLSAASLVALAFTRTSEQLFLTLALVHFLAFVPTIPLSNAICLDALDDPEAQFAQIRVFGTLGWIAGGILIGAIPNALVTPLPMHLAAAAMLLLSAYAWAMPGGGAPDTGRKLTWGGLLGLDALGAIRQRAFWLVAGITAISSIPLAFYNAYCATFLQEVGAVIAISGYRFEPTAVQALGQISELLFLLSLPMALRLLDIRGVLLMGLVGWIVRCACFILALSPPMGLSSGPLVVAGIVLHGMCYDFMLIGAALFVDRCVSSELRSRAQAFLTFVTMGLGITLGSVIANMVYSIGAGVGGRHDWAMVWGTVAAIAAGSLIILVVNFRKLDAEPSS